MLDRETGIRHENPSGGSGHDRREAQAEHMARAGVTRDVVGMDNWNPEDYSLNSSEQFRWACGLIQKLGLTGRERVLDIGCGDGRVTAEIARRLPLGHVIGIDKSPSMIQHARDNFSGENIVFQLIGAEDLRFDEEFDIVFSNAVLHWVRDHAPVLSGIGRSLAPGGRALLQMGGRGNADAVLESVKRAMRRERFKHYFEQFVFPYAFHGPEEYEAWLLRAGLEPVRVELIEKNMTHIGQEAFAGWFRTTWHPFINAVPPVWRIDFIDEVIGDYLHRNPPDEKGMVHTRMVRLEAEARKKTLFA